MFIKWKPTAINWIFAIVFWGSQFFGKKCLIQTMLEKNISLPQPIWLRLNSSWAIFFILMGILNLYVVYNFDTDTWINFKLFGLMSLTIVFVVIQFIYISKHLKLNENKE
ncbi:MAG: Intracellular septation protein [Legionellaceae bacterium]